MINRMIADFNVDEDLCNDVTLCAMLDWRYSEFRRVMRSEPHKLPEPFWLSSRPSWPWRQLTAWQQAGSPEHFDLPASDFMPSGISTYDKGRPEEPYAIWASLDASLGT